MKSDIFTLNKYDLIKGLQMYLITTIIMSLGSVVFMDGFSVFTADWKAIFMNTIDVSVIATFSYLTKNFFSSKDSV